MTSVTIPHSALALAILVLLFAATPCDGCDSQEKEPDPWLFTSEDADFSVVLPGHWQSEPRGSVNPHADIAASRDDTYFFMVIPQELPTFPRPDVFEFKRTALQTLDGSVEDFVIARQGPIELDGQSGVTVFANGTLNDRNIRYITSYVIRGDVGFQIIAFTEMDNESTLISEMDIILSTWRFSPDQADQEIH